MSKKASKTKSSKSPSKKAKPAKVAAAEAVVTTAAKPEREVRNGVQRPREGGLCAAVWTALDQMHAAGTVPATQNVRDLATAKGWNENNATAELSAWRKFMGLSKPHNMKRKRAQAKEQTAVVTEVAAS